jgi:hypothetical protein
MRFIMIEKARAKEKTLDLTGGGGIRYFRKEVKFVVYYESIKREPKIRGIKKCRCDERLKLKQRNLRASHTLGWSWNWNT